SFRHDYALKSTRAGIARVLSCSHLLRRSKLRDDLHDPSGRNTAARRRRAKGPQTRGTEVIQDESRSMKAVGGAPDSDVASNCTPSYLTPNYLHAASRRLAHGFR